MDKEAQHKELASIIDKHHIGCNLPKECDAECNLCAAEAIYEAGYRKPLDRPKLLSANDIYYQINKVDPGVSLLERDLWIAQAQREADIKHYEGG